MGTRRFYTRSRSNARNKSTACSARTDASLSLSLSLRRPGPALRPITQKTAAPAARRCHRPAGTCRPRASNVGTSRRGRRGRATTAPNRQHRRARLRAQVQLLQRTSRPPTRPHQGGSSTPAHRESPSASDRTAAPARGPRVPSACRARDGSCRPASRQRCPECASRISNCDSTSSEASSSSATASVAPGTRPAAPLRADSVFAR